MANKALEKLSGALKGLKNQDYSTQKAGVSKVGSLAGDLLKKAASALAKALPVVTDLMRGIGAKLEDKVPALSGLSDLLLFYALYSVVMECMNLMQIQGYLSSFLLKLAPLLIYAMSLAISAHRKKNASAPETIAEVAASDDDKK